MNQLPQSITPTATLPSPWVMPGLGKKQMTMAAILQVVAECYGLKPKDLLRPHRHEPLISQRRMAIYCCYILRDQISTGNERTITGYVAIGKFFRQDHTTIINAVRKMRNLIYTEPETNIKVTKMITHIKNKLA